MASDEQILQKWGEYVSEAESNLAEQQSNINSKLNSNDYTAQQKVGMASDLSKQQDYVDQLKYNYQYLQDEYAQGHALPSTVKFNVNGSGLIYHSGWDGKYHPIHQNSGGSWAYADNDYNYYSIVKSDEVNFCIMIPKTATNINRRGFRFTHNDYVGKGAKLSVPSGNVTVPVKDIRNRVSGRSDIYIYDQNQNIGTTAEIVETISSMSNVPNIDGNFSIGNFVYNLQDSGSSWISYFSKVGIGQEYDLGEEDVPTDSPWDYYNDDVLPTIDEDNAIFPDGYHPPDPHDPPIEPDMYESDEGTPPAPFGWDGMITDTSTFITQYVLNANLLKLLGENLWQSWLTTGTDVWENFLFNFSSQTGTFNITAALDYIISLRVYPFDLWYSFAGEDVPEGFFSESDGVYMGTGKTNFTYQYSAYPIKVINSLSAMMNLGTCKVESQKAPFDDFRDIYNCTILCYLPFCGTVELNPADVWNRMLKCTYFIDFHSGGCTALVECEGDEGYFPVALKSGQIGFTLPLTATNAGQVAAQFASDAVRAVGTMAGMALDIGANIGNSVSSAIGAVETGDISGQNTFTSSVAMGKTAINGGMSLANQALNILSRSGINMPMLSGGTGTENLMMYREPFIEIRRGKYAKPENFPHSVGYANATSSTIGDYTGLTCFTGVDTTGLNCHADEMAEIVELLQSGVYL